MILRVGLQFALGIFIPFAFQWWDKSRSRLTPLAGSWNGATWASALLAFGPFSMLGWFWVTRRSRARLALGTAAALASVSVIWAIDELFAYVTG